MSFSFSVTTNGDASGMKTPLIGNMVAPVAHMGSPRAMMSIFDAFIPFFSGGRLFATLDKPYYVPGELVTGQIVADLSMPVSARGIDLLVTGYEKAEWHDVSNESESDPNGGFKHFKKAVRHRGKKTFFTNKQRIYNIANGIMMPGQHTFPFSYQLPEGLPGSFYVREKLEKLEDSTVFEDKDKIGDNFYDSDDEDAAGPSGSHHGHGHGYTRSALLAVVMYKLKVTLDVNGFFHPDLHARIPLILHPKLSSAIQPALAQLSSNVTVCCCLNKGTCHVSAHFDKTAYTRGETAQITADIDNQSTESLSMVVKLHRAITLKSGAGGHGSSKIDRRVVVEQKYEAAPPHTKIQRHMPLALNSDDVKPTTDAEFVQCQYTYTVEGQISMGSDIVLKMPVVVYAPQPRPIGQ